MEWLVSNWFLIIVLIAVLIFVISWIRDFIRKPPEMQIENIKEWLKYACFEAEMALGSGTGQLKLRMVYNLAIKNFSFLSKIISFEVFSRWVDEALEWVNKQLDSNPNVKNLLNGGDVKNEFEDDLR